MNFLESTLYKNIQLGEKKFVVFVKTQVYIVLVTDNFMRREGVFSSKNGNFKLPIANCKMLSKTKIPKSEKYFQKPLDKLDL